MKKTKLLNIRVSEKQFERIQNLAEASGLSISAYLRNTALMPELNHKLNEILLTIKNMKGGVEEDGARF